MAGSQMANAGSGSRGDVPISRMFTSSPATPAAQQIQVGKLTFARGNATISHQTAQAALNTKTGQTLVVWWETNSDNQSISGRMVNNLGTPVSAQFTLVTGTTAAAVAYNPVSNEFLLVYPYYVNGRQDPSMFGQRLDAKGHPVGSPVDIANDAASKTLNNANPIATFNPKSGGYTVLWDRGIFSGGQTISLVGVVLTQNLAKSGPIVTIHKTNGVFSYGQSLAYLPSGNKLLVAITDLTGVNMDTKGVFMLATLDPLLKGITPANTSKVSDTPIPRGNTGYFWGASIAVLQDLTARYFYGDNTNVKERKIDANGKLSGPSFLAFNTPKNNTVLSFASAAFATNSKGTSGLLIAVENAVGPETEDGFAATWAQVLDAQGHPKGSPLQVYLNNDCCDPKDPVGVSSTSGLTTALPGKPADTVFRFNWFGTIVQQGPDLPASILKLTLTLQ